MHDDAPQPHLRLVTEKDLVTEAPPQSCDDSPVPRGVVLRPGNTEDGARRVLWVGSGLIGLISLLMVALLGRVILLQTQPSTPIASRIGSQHGTRPILARRGNLLDRRGRVLATSRVVKRLFADPGLIEEPGTFVERVGHELDYDPAWLARKIDRRPHSRYVALDTRLSDDRIERVKHFRLRGLGTQDHAVRDYPQGSLAGQLIGFVGADGLGLEGLERVYDRDLIGRDGELRYLRDSGRRVLWVEQSAYATPSDGDAIRLSIDATLQHFAETELAAACNEFDAESGQMVMIDPQTGQVLAMANHPVFDPNLFRDSNAALRRNRCVTDTFEPGSTLKPMVWAAATQAGTAGIDEVIDCTESGFFVTEGGRRLRDAHGLGKLTWAGVLARSSNIGMAIIGQRMGAARLHQTVRAFGLGTTTASGLPGEVAGTVHPLHKWNHYSVTSVPMGQEVAVTPLQLAVAFGVIANGGELIRPSVIAAPATPYSPVLGRVLTEQTAELTKRVLRTAVSDPHGTGRRANSPLYEIFGKTGTAQVANPDGGGYLEDQYISSFVAGAPLERPAVVVVCVIHRPDKSIGHYGGAVAAPAVRRVIEKSLVYLGVPTLAAPDAIPAGSLVARE